MQQVLEQIEQRLLRMMESCFAIHTVTAKYEQGHLPQNKYTNILMPYYH